MIAGASKVLVSVALVLVASVPSIALAAQVETGTCETQRQRCVDRCGSATPIFDCDMSDNGNALAFSCACTGNGMNADISNVTVANTDRASDEADPPNQPIVTRKGSNASISARIPPRRGLMVL